MKLAHQAARALHHEIRDGALPAAARIGSTGDLAMRYGVSVEIMRDALLLGGRMELVTMRRGRGGVFVGGPDRTRTIAEATLHLRAAAGPAALLMLRQALASTDRAGVTADLVLAILDAAIADPACR